MRNFILNAEDIKLIENEETGDYSVKIKMATIGVKNRNGLIIENDATIKYEDKPYPLFFNHEHDMNNMIGTFTVLGVDGSDIIAEANLTSDKAINLVKSGALTNASITYVIRDYDYDEKEDAVVVKNADLVELSLVLNPADETAKVMNSLKDELLKQNEEADDVMNINKEELVAIIDELKVILDKLESLRAEDEILDSDEDDTEEPDIDIEAANRRRDEIKNRWGGK